MSNNKAFKVKNGLELADYNKSISDTAVDVFVYDTHKDSDGGAWRKRTQHTSWYNETLNTSTRGSRKEFPAVAVIVAEQGDVTIYDGDDPDLPMWMVFQSGGGWNAKIIATSNATTSLNAMNGMLAIGTAPISQGVLIVSFLEDMTRAYIGTADYGGTDTAPLSLRNTTGHTFARAVSGGNDLPLIVNTNVNDVAMTVLPNAPIDAATGLPVPTIAVATDGGVSVIKDDGTVVDSSDTSSYKTVGFLDDYKLLGSETTSSYSTVIFSDYNSDGFSILKAYLSTSQPPMIIAPSYSLPTGNNFAAYRLGSWGLINVARQPENEDNGMVAHTTSSYNTGWMNGDIKLATLSDTDTTNVTGSELVTNGDFSSGTTGWNAYNAVISVSSGQMTVDDTANAGSNSSAISNGISLSAGTYTISVEVISTTDSAYIAFTTNNSITPNGGWNVAANVPAGIYSTTITVTGTSTYYVWLCTNGTSVTVFDNISVRLAEEDRSVNGNGLQVLGTVTKSAVATGADLVGYSGFSSSNYLEQPYNSDLDFGTGDFCVMGWAKGADTSGRLLLRANPANDQNRFSVDVSSGTIRFFTFDTTSQLIDSGYTIGDNWVFVCAVRTGGYQYIYIDGTSMGTPVASTKDVTNSNAVVTLGEDTRLSTPYAGSLALWRISATAPSPEQIKKIYEDEKFLFQDGAQATLYGSSDAVTALAYDDSTELLHVGTSAGRSVFQGLRRVDNTTTAVGAAISASNSMVAED